MTKKEEQELKRQAKLEKERARIETMKVYEKEYETHGWVCGIDEVGRGPLCGPVVAAACILPNDVDIPRLNDSKKLTPKIRMELFEQIKEKALAYSIAFGTVEEIDEINILQATYEAMRQAISSLSVKPAVLLNDAVTIPGVEIPQIPIIKGDAKSVSIAAASIIAKVTRDRMMVEYDRLYPGYDLASNKGYGTKVHMDALKTVGPCEIHRRSFIKNICG